MKFACAVLRGITETISATGHSTPPVYEPPLTQPILPIVNDGKIGAHLCLWCMMWHTALELPFTFELMNSDSRESNAWRTDSLQGVGMYGHHNFSPQGQTTVNQAQQTCVVIRRQQHRSQYQLAHNYKSCSQL